ncbi:GFA family protein [Sphingomonas sp. JC676]|uniref:GFA family protein n=1 Tax=Sphingomonas sp. JC676 TaxID=2768065 RepID=UPI0016577D39|nr:GFA family protein [Sphingomonas sp. JC676]MBC9032036.1 GFA family protein [Sphingomonas sp. JC676]
MEGGCLCGAVRYRLLSDPFDAGWCHCRNCQRISGAPAVAFASVLAADYVYESGAELVGRYASTPTDHRGFCTRCGSQLYGCRNDGPTIEFNLATLDDPAPVVPGFHIYYERHIPWAEAADDKPRHARSRRETPEL